MQSLQLRDNQTLNLQPLRHRSALKINLLALLHPPLALPIRHPDLPLNPGNALRPLRAWHPDPAFPFLLRHENHFPLPRGQQVADHQVVVVAVQRLLGLGDEEVRVRLEFEGDDQTALGRPGGDQRAEELGHRVQVDHELDARARGRAGGGLGGAGVGGLDLVLLQPVARDEEVGHGRGQVEERAAAGGLHERRQAAELEEVLRHAGEG